MNFFNMFKKSAKTTGGINNQRQLEYNKFFGSGQYATTPYDEYKINPILGDSVDMISERFSSLNPVIKNDKNEILKKHPVLDILKNPNSIDTYFKFATELSSNFLLNNNAYLEVEGFYKSKPSSIYNIRYTEVNITQQVNQALYVVTSNMFYQFLSGHFIINHETGRILDGTLIRELLHIKGFTGSSNAMRAASKVLSLKKELGVIDQTSNRNVAMLRGGMSATGIVSIDTDDSEAVDRIASDIKSRFSGSNNSGNTIVSKGKDITYTSLDTNNKDMQGLENKIESKNTVYSRYDIPGPLINADSQTYSNYQTAIGALYDNAVFPLANVIFESLTKMFQQRKMLKDNEFITYDDSNIPAVRFRRFQEMTEAQKSRALTVDEIREVGGYEDVKDGEFVYIPNNLFPIGKEVELIDPVSESVPTKNNDKSEFMDLMTKNKVSQEDAEKYWNDYEV